MHEHNKELIKAVTQNAEIAKSVLFRMIDITDDAVFRQAMANEFAEYHDILKRAKEHSDRLCVKPSKGVKTLISSSIRFNTMIDKTSSHLAEMLIQGSTMSVIDLKRAIKEYNFADDDIKGLANSLIKTEQNNIHSLLEHV